jgi:hypothetical protein
VILGDSDAKTESQEESGKHEKHEAVVFHPCLNCLPRRLGWCSSYEKRGKNKEACAMERHGPCGLVFGD